MVIIPLLAEYHKLHGKKLEKKPIHLTQVKRILNQHSRTNKTLEGKTFSIGFIKRPK